MLYSVIYTSDAIIENGRHELHNLLFQARLRNQKLEITGMLVYCDNKFIQVLEGEKNRVLSLYKTIRKDSRHIKVKTLLEKEIEHRMFPDWTMGYKNIDSDTYKNIPGFTLFLDNDEADNPYDLLLYFKDDPNCFEKLAPLTTVNTICNS